MTVLLDATRRWYCPNCKAQSVTKVAKPHTQFHTCLGLKGLTAPMVPVGTRAKVEAKEREDYVGKEDVRVDGEGRPIMSIITTREDGSNDVTVFAPTARGKDIR